MDEGLKQRLVGAVVLVALAVIFIPMLLENHRSANDFEQRFGRPDRPEVDYLAQGPDVAPLVLPEARPDGDAGPPLERAGGPEARPVARPGTAVAAGSGAETDVAEGSSRTPDTGQEKKSSTAGQAGGSGWAVQVASFRSRVNAEKLRDRARAAGFTAYVEDAGPEQKARYRVRVGPERDRASAVETQNRLKQKLGMEGMLVRHPRDGF